MKRIIYEFVKMLCYVVPGKMIVIWPVDRNDGQPFRSVVGKVHFEAC